MRPLEWIDTRFEYAAEVLAQLRYIIPSDRKAVHRIVLAFPFLVHISISNSLPTESVLGYIATVELVVLLVYAAVAFRTLQIWDQWDSNPTDSTKRP